VFLKIPVVYTQNTRYNYDLTFKCKATINVDKPSIHWIIGRLDCQIRVGARDKVAMAMLTEPTTQGPNGDNEKLPPIHPGELLKVWLMEKPKERTADVLWATDLSRQQLDSIINCESPIDERTAMELSKIFGAEAEFWFRMQFAFDFFQKTGHEPEKAELPQLMRRVPEMA